MWFQIGVPELMLVVVALAVAMAVAWKRPAFRSWPVAAPLAMLGAAAITPADPVSTLIVGAVFLLFFGAGVSVGGSHDDPAAAEG